MAQKNSPNVRYRLAGSVDTRRQETLDHCGSTAQDPRRCRSHDMFRMPLRAAENATSVVATLVRGSARVKVLFETRLSEPPGDAGLPAGTSAELDECLTSLVVTRQRNRDGREKAKVPLPNMNP